MRQSRVVAVVVNQLNTIIHVASRLADRGTVPWSRQLRIAGPNRGCRSSQACSRGDPRVAAQAARRMKTVVGKPGNTMPIKPSSRQV